jgi:hypothetical protein
MTEDDISYLLIGIFIGACFPEFFERLGRWIWMPFQMVIFVVCVAYLTIYNWGRKPQ